MNPLPGLDALPRPTPALGMAAYRAEREAALNHSTACRQNYEAFLREGRVAGPSYWPIKLDIEPISRCNFACQMCAVSEWEKGTRAKDLALEHFCAILESQPGLVEIKLQGLGEPLLLGDDFFQMIRVARKRRIWVRTTTNASRLHLQDKAFKLIESGVNEIQISIDGATKDTFQNIRRQSRFEVVVNNCALINRVCDERERPVTKSWTVVQSANVHELEQIVDLVQSLGFRSHVFSLDLHGWGDAYLSEVNATKRVDREISTGRLKGLIDRGREQGLKVEFWSINEKFSTESVDKLCPWPFERSFVSSDQRTVPCCMISNPDVFELGKGLDFASAWCGNQYQQFRKAHLIGEIPRVCQSCYKA